MSRHCSIREAAQQGIAVALCIAFFSGPAKAQTETVPVAEFILTASAGAFSAGVYSSSVHDNVVVDIGTTSGVVLQNAIFANLGIVQVNQDAGNASNQANMILIAIGAGGSVADSGLHLQISHANNTVHSGNVTRTNTIQNILDGSAGIVQINQNAGNTNVGLNFLGIALGLSKGEAAVVLSDTTLGATSTNNKYTVEGTLQQSNTISGLSNFTGIAQIAQTNGDGNVAANTMSIGIVVLNK
jgi:hypothetical protein